MVGVAKHTKRGNAWSRNWADDKKKESAALAISVTEFVSVVTMAQMLGGSTPARIFFTIMSKVIPDISCLRMARNYDGVRLPRLCGCMTRAAC